MRFLSTISLLLFASAVCVAETVESGHADFFDPERIVEVQIEMDPDQWIALRSQTRALSMAIRKPAPPTPFTYFNANVIVDGKRFDDVGIRKKGFVGSLDQNYPSLKIKFDKYVDREPFHGMRRLTLNNNKQDASVISQFLAYQLFAKADLPAPRCNFARVTVNDTYLGIYSNVESVKQPFLKRAFGNADGKLYEGTLADFFVERIEEFERKIGDKNNRDELMAVAELLQQESIDTAELSKHLDIDQFLRYWAMESLINFWDGYTNNQNNFFVYHDPTDSGLHFIPWGTDAVCQPNQYIPSEHKSVHLKAILPRRLYQTEGMADRYRDTLTELLDTVWDESALLKEIDRIETLLKEHTHRRQRSFTDSIGNTRGFIKSRRKKLEAEMEGWPLSAKGRALEPTYSDSVGTVTGSFTAPWKDRSPESAYGVGTAELKLILEGETVEFAKTGVYGTTKKDKRGEETRTILFVGKRESNGIRIKLRFALSEDRFESANSDLPVVVQGNLEEGGFGAFGLLSTHGVRLAGGMMTVNESSDDETLSASVELDIVRFVEDKRKKKSPSKKKSTNK